jgi:TPR repeat protein
LYFCLKINYFFWAMSDPHLFFDSLILLFLINSFHSFIIRFSINKHATTQPQITMATVAKETATEKRKRTITDLDVFYASSSFVSNQPDQVKRRIAMGYTAARLDMGFGVRRNQARAQCMFVEAAFMGDLYSRAIVLMKGWGTALDSVSGFTLLMHAAANGHIAAEYDVGLCFRDGLGCEKNEPAAIDFLLQSAFHGYAPAQHALGDCFYVGKGVDADPMQAVMWYERAAKQGLALAQNQLGVCYDKGTGVTHNPARAVEWYQRAADQGFATAQHNLGVCYVRGSGVIAARTTAAAWFQRAADQGLAKAQHNLALLYALQGNASNQMRALMWYQRAANQGHVKSLYSLGVCYEHGYGVKQDLHRAVGLYKRAADRGYEKAKIMSAKLNDALLLLWFNDSETCERQA